MNKVLELPLDMHLLCFILEHSHHPLVFWADTELGQLNRVALTSQFSVFFVGHLTFLLINIYCIAAALHTKQHIIQAPNQTVNTVHDHVHQCA